MISVESGRLIQSVSAGGKDQNPVGTVMESSSEEHAVDHATPVMEDLSAYDDTTPNDSHYYVDSATPHGQNPPTSSYSSSHKQTAPPPVRFVENESVDLDEDIPLVESSDTGFDDPNLQTQTIHPINKDLRRQFQGRSQSVAKIRWFENRKSQVLGFCLCMAMIGLTMAFFTYRWTGLVTGSALTLVSSSAVIYTYQRRKRWHQHPNPIVFMRSVLSMFFAICLLINVLVEYQPQDDIENCRYLAGFTEFFLITTEAWGLMMACDLFSSLMSPFANYKRQMKFYHFWVWTLGIISAIVAWGVSDAGGFFLVDGQKLHSAERERQLVGFCLATSQQCCSEDDKTCTQYPQCATKNFLNAQQWPWILVYSFVIFVLIVSVSVLMLAWHRLYLRGVPKTYHIRLRVLNYVSFFTGAYVFYWLLLLLLYMTAYFVSSKNLQGDAAQVLRQLVMFIIASKGYLDYVIWFAVNSIEWGDTNNNDSAAADVDVDLSPQVNTALRSEILYYTTTGIKHSVTELRGHESGRSRQEVFLLGSGGDPKDKHHQKIKFWSYNPYTFRQIREFFGILDADYTKLFHATTKERFSEGRSGAFMFFTGDESLIVKTMSQEECHLLRKITKDYAYFLMHNSRSLLTRFYGCHAVSLYGKTYYFVVMGNLFADTGTIHHRYDIKGSWVARNASHPKQGGTAHCRYCNASYTYGSKRNQECGDGFNYHEPDIVLKDNDLLAKIRIDPQQADFLYEQLCSDSEFLCQKGIMDYSLLMGVQSCEYFVEPGSLTARRMDESQTNQDAEDYGFRSKIATSVNGPALYHFGVIDFLQQWTFEKKAERFYKTKILRKDPDGVSALPTAPYMMRFQQKMAQIFAVSTTAKLGRETNHYGGNEYTGMQSGLLDALDQGPRGTQVGMTPDMRESRPNTAVATPLLHEPNF